MKPSELKAIYLADNLKADEVYAGLILGQNGQPDYHLILLPGDIEATWKQAQTFAKKAGGELPTRREQSLLFANCKDHFKSTWYWSGEPYASDASYAWYQDFYDGGQCYGHLSSQLRARAVRRLPIE
jgi:hypothetical protein